MTDEMSLRTILSRNIKRNRQRKGWSQAKLAEKTGISTIANDSCGVFKVEIRSISLRESVLKWHERMLSL